MMLFGSFALDTSNQCLWRDGEQISLPPKPFSVLRYLVEHPGRLITHDELLDALWPETYVQPQVLRTYMLELRKVLADDREQPRFIQTLPKRGYRFVAEVKEGERPRLEAASTSTQATEAPTPGASPLTFAAATGIVGREEELVQLRSQLQSAASGKRRTVFITGEAGIGKTALVDAFCGQMSRLPCITARGQCIEGLGGKEEYYPVMEALSQLCASPDGERACRVLTRMAPVWLASLKRDGDAHTGSSPVERMPGELCAALEELAAEKLLLLIFEDLHWADNSTLHLISALARRRAESKLLLVATFRPHSAGATVTRGADGSRSTSLDRVNGNSKIRQGDRRAPADQSLRTLKQDLAMRRLCEEIPLAPLAKPAVKELLMRELKQESLPPGLAGFVHQHSEGNPLFVIAILEHLIAQKFLARVAVEGTGAWEQRASFQDMEAGVPEGLAQMIELEMERLTPQEQRLLEAGSLISVAFPAWAVAAALEEDPSEIEEACDDLVRRLYFLHRAGEDELPDGSRSAFYAFAHGLYREVLYRRQSASRRARRHTRIAERLGQLFAGREAYVAREMSMHYEAAGNWSRALHALRLAAVHAVERQAGAEAAFLLQHGLQIAQNLPEQERESSIRAIHRELTAMQEPAIKANEAPHPE